MRLSTFCGLHRDTEQIVLAQHKGHERRGEVWKQFRLVLLICPKIEY
jgi:hypothetical protein